MLGRMFCSGFAENLAAGSDIPLGMHSPDLSATVFRTILDFYLCGKMSCPPYLDIRSLKEACDYFLIPFNYHTVRCNNISESLSLSVLTTRSFAGAFLHELSDDGAYRAFEGFFDMHILPKLVDCTRSGERESHLVILMDDETISWDEDYPPQLPDNELNAHLVFSTQMYRFLKYNENREVAKKFLIAKYLKKIRIGIEGYPTCKERVKYRGHRPEVIYNYAQRPFIHMSWEHEENKSRHVDFQCVKSKSASDLTALEQVLVGAGTEENSQVVEVTAAVPAVVEERESEGEANQPHSASEAGNGNLSQTDE
ncbi:BTB/POZ domain-containing protein 10 [Cichlidogyrus casuarinus]|uniref:BTB/POZ domain-containing protein 10 n=1 Tax=Cichlidogyrus casuarinus TaxID=1844966 RepID=A0ABD2PPY0_9PLAT